MVKKASTVHVPGTGEAGKTTLEWGFSSSNDEFMQLTIKRSDPDDRCSWSLHLGAKQAVALAAWILTGLPVPWVLRVLAIVVEARPDVATAIRALEAERK